MQECNSRPKEGSESLLETAIRSGGVAQGRLELSPLVGSEPRMHSN